jgi:hypothetical protein
VQTNHALAAPVVVGRVLLAAIAMALPAASSPAVAMPPVVHFATWHADSSSRARAGRVADCWYAEGRFRLRSKRYSLFAGATVTQFTSASTRAVFGWGSVSPVIELYRPQRRGVSPALEFSGTRIANEAQSAQVFAASVGVRYRPVDAERTRWMVPIASMTFGPRFARTSTAGRTTVGGAGVSLGVEMRRTVRVAARYEVLPPVHGGRLSTIALAAAVRLPFPPRRAARERQDPSTFTACAAPAGEE